MQNCSKCNATLPDYATGCQFCGNSWATGRAASAPTSAAGKLAASMGGQGWVWPAYYAISGWWVVDGCFNVLRSTLFAPQNGSGGAGLIGIVAGAISILVGMGLLLRIDVVRNLVNFMCFANIFFGAIGILFGFILAPLTGFWGAVSLLLDFVQIGLSGLMIYVIGETETRGPNF